MRHALLSLLVFSIGCRETLEDTSVDPLTHDGDGDGSPLAEDCDDTNAAIHPGADEVCNQVDDDCDGEVDEDATDAQVWYTDRDGDGFGDGAPTTACVAPPGATTTPGDCDDNRSDINPNAVESDCTDDTDYNCDGSTGFDDADGDGVPACEDCDDTAANVNPNAPELCDGVDNDCDGGVDNNALNTTVRYADTDGDGFGDADAPQTVCGEPVGTTSGLLATDCDDERADVYPGATEFCNDVDHDCDGQSRDADASDAATWYADLDGDGVAGTRQNVVACDAPPNHYAEANDCDDLRATAYPGAVELCNTLDDDCDGDIDEAADLGTVTFFRDADGDGHGDPAQAVEDCNLPEGYSILNNDCDDSRADVNPRAEERCDDVDRDCNGNPRDPYAADAPQWYRDVDGDTYAGSRDTTRACDAPTGHYANATDCDDLRNTAYPGATELCNGLDDDCDGQVPPNEADADGDGLRACAGDCDDSRADVRPGAPESCDDIDHDCNGNPKDSYAADAPSWFLDADGDSYGRSSPTLKACEAPPSYVANDDDCDDLRAAVNPAATEVCNGRDDNCDGVTDPATSQGAPTWYADGDGDGFGDVAVTRVQCEAPTGYVADSRDCDDVDGTINPDADEVCDEVDRDCDGDNLNGPPGSDALCASGSCLELLDADPSAPDGQYWIDPDGSGGLPPWEARCDMTTAGGGWTAIPYAADLAYQNHFPTGGNQARWQPVNFTLAWSSAQVAALKAVSTEGRQRYVARCNGVLHYFYQSSNSYIYAAGFRLHDGTEVPGRLQSYAPFNVSVVQDGCQNNGSEGGLEVNATIFNFVDTRLPILNIQTFDNGDANELHGSPLTQNPAWFR